MTLEQLLEGQKTASIQVLQGFPLCVKITVNQEVYKAKVINNELVWEK